jgi:hypothetical protein
MARLGYADTVMRACAAANGHELKGVDVDATELDEIDSGCLGSPLSSSLP